MQNTSTQALPPLGEYEGVPVSQQRFAPFYETLPGYEWFIRRNRGQLVATGAMIIVAGRRLLHPQLTEAVILKAAQRAALGGCSSHDESRVGRHG